MEEKIIEKEAQKPASEHTGKTNYVAVFIILAVLTGIEIAVTQLPLPRVPILLPLSVIKASLVALFYMHLKTDKPLLGAIFGFGVLIGVSLIVSFIVLFTVNNGGLNR